jgi:hypothetical protein
MVHCDPEHVLRQGDAPGLRSVIEYPYHRRGSTTLWDRGQAKIRPAAPVECSLPLGPRLAEHDEKIVWIEVHIEVDPTKVSAAVADQHESAADCEFQKHRPDHFISATT